MTPQDELAAALREELHHAADNDHRLPDGSPAVRAAYIEAVLDRYAALPAQVAASGEGLTGRAVHAAWRDGMLAQGREVARDRMTWEVLSQQDRDLDDGIAAALRLSSEAVPAGVDRLRAAVEFVIGYIDWTDPSTPAEHLSAMRSWLLATPEPETGG